MYAQGAIRAYSVGREDKRRASDTCNVTRGADSSEESWLRSFKSGCAHTKSKYLVCRVCLDPDHVHLSATCSETQLRSLRCAWGGSSSVEQSCAGTHKNTHWRCSAASRSSSLPLPYPEKMGTGTTGNWQEATGNITRPIISESSEPGQHQELLCSCAELQIASSYDLHIEYIEY